ncbi:hypothetical protein LMG28727_07357 [Paraburkholderia kirstenboschensis]|nr:hypothetical protein LMG28727_07357 [Paraburkholderia kirstenboschensis]
MERSAKQVYRLTGREAMYSPGAPSLGHVMKRYRGGMPLDLPPYLRTPPHT